MLTRWSRSSNLNVNIETTKGPQPVTVAATTPTEAASGTDAGDDERIFADPAADRDPATWHAAAHRLRVETPIIEVSPPDYVDFRKEPEPPCPP